MVKEEISGNFLEVGRKSDKLMATVLTLSKEMIRIIRGDPKKTKPTNL